MKLPHDEKAEKALIGSLMIKPGLIPSIMVLTDASHFFDLPNRDLYGLLVSMWEARTPIDMVTVENELKRAPRAISDRSGDYLADCLTAIGSYDHAEYYAKMVSRLYYEREIIKACKEMAEGQESEVLGKITKMVNLKDGLEAPGTFSYKTDLYGFLDRILTRKESDNINTGFGILDESWHGTRPGEINTWCAATNVGKSLMLLNLMHNAATSGRRCLYVGTEMSADETTQRHLSISSEVHAWKIRAPKLDEQDIVELNNSLADSLSKMQVNILDKPEPSLRDIEAAISATKPEIVFLDYLERFQLPKEESLRLKIREFMRQLKTMARSKNVIIHLASQLNRQAYGKEDTRPSMAEISESSAVEKESDRVILMWAPKLKQEMYRATNKTCLELIVAKNRHGAKGMIFDMILNNNTLRIAEPMS